MSTPAKTLRLILGDQLNLQHSWLAARDQGVTYVLMEVASETSYVRHHIQKVAGFFAAMRQFARQLETMQHRVVYIRLNDSDNLQTFDRNIRALITREGFTRFEYQRPDEYRVDQHLKALCDSLPIPTAVADTEHFLGSREELTAMWAGKKTLLMETFYHTMRRKHGLLMEGRAALQQVGTETIGHLEGDVLTWPIDRTQSLELLQFFVKECLQHFGTYQDAMTPHSWAVYHSRLSFSLNLKMISPKEVIDAAIAAWQAAPETIAFHQLEGFVRQIAGWREYVRGVYWLHMPAYEQLNYFGHQRPLPAWYWTGNTRMHCLSHTIKQSLQYAYAHHIQRLMVTGNFALLAGIHPSAVDEWYLGIYIDALQWVELPNTRGMSQFADGGL
ncbi:MAG: cryptochrome/photolyase family protein, partial [Chitinophagia bacterium]|nr:cryptochrome/photolyase family protein [Chitinophagia bacterium]